ncbi:MAG: hypothetical protein K5989_01895 [Lachnospiraceae bacterium]|nr:hypothetical protein [Lachnospiraceae bacterium]
MVSLYSMAHAIVERELSYEVLTRENYLIWHESPYVSPTFQEFIELVKSFASQILS